MRHKLLKPTSLSAIRRKKNKIIEHKLSTENLTLY